MFSQLHYSWAFDSTYHHLYSVKAYYCQQHFLLNFTSNFKPFLHCPAWLYIIMYFFCSYYCIYIFDFSVKYILDSLSCIIEYMVIYWSKGLKRGSRIACKLNYLASTYQSLSRSLTPFSIFSFSNDIFFPILQTHALFRHRDRRKYSWNVLKHKSIRTQLCINM